MLNFKLTWLPFATLLKPIVATTYFARNYCLHKFTIHTYQQNIMKKNILILFCLFLYQAKAQDYGSSLGFNLGFTGNGLGVMADYNYYANRFNNSSINIAAAVSLANYTYRDYDIRYSVYAIQLGYTQQVWEIYRGPRKRILRLGILFGGQVGYELINNGYRVLSPELQILQKSQFIYGPYLGAEIDYNLGNQTSLILHANENYHFNSETGSLIPYFGIGLRFYNSY
ncbi:conjugal transfer protein TraO [Allomuricauda taeanensis]|uniref:conjugal transfer protein TraO n=1 Tax=Flagellimonas taeanensis TaxID=1005926 RepID=UPI002E7BC25D|nr:conjugal transfer protein TraO [Allomuricauda taeanensis]MEE1964572.1 conjugal transfer protein TraO [Allomuricauda taeanensis]